MLGITLGKVALFVALMLVVGARVFPWILQRVVRTKSRELFTLAAIALALGSPTARRGCSMSRWRSAPSSPAW